MDYGNTSTSIEVNKHDVIFHIDYDIPGDLDGDGDGDWGHSACISAVVSLDKMRVVDGELEILSLGDMTITDGFFYNHVLDEGTTVDSEHFSKWEVIEIVLNTISRDDVEEIEGLLKDA